MRHFKVILKWFSAIAQLYSSRQPCRACSVEVVRRLLLWFAQVPNGESAKLTDEWFARHWHCKTYLFPLVVLARLYVQPHIFSQSPAEIVLHLEWRHVPSTMRLWSCTHPASELEASWEKNTSSRNLGSGAASCFAKLRIIIFFKILNGVKRYQDTINIFLNKLT